MGKVLIEEENLTNIANSIRSKTGSTDTMTPSEMSGNVDSIEGMSDYFDTAITNGVQDSYGWTKAIKKTPKFTFNGRSANYLFASCNGVTEIDLSGVDTSNTTSMDHMFAGCFKITTLDLSNFNTEKLTNMNYMFSGCSGLTSLDLSSFTAPNLTNVSWVFERCTKLTHIDIRNLDFTNDPSISGIFGANSTFGVPDNCEIIVKNEYTKTYITSKNSRLTNVKTVAEYESEV